VQPFSNGLPAAVAVLVGARVVVCALHAWAVVRGYPVLRRVSGPRRGEASRLWSTAGWLTVSGVVSPVLVSADRFVVGAVLPVAAVAYYSTASEVATKMWLFTAALQPVLFPALAASLVRSPEAAAALFDRAVRATIAVLAPAALLLVLFGRDAVTVWLGADVARAAGPALQWLSVAVFVNSVAQVPYAAVQGGGRADVAAKLHLIELPLYAGLLWWLAHEHGLLGVALAWLARMAADGFVLLALSGRALPALAVPARRAAVATFVVAAGLCACTLPVSLGARLAAALAGFVALAAAVPLGLVTPAERAALRRWVGGRRAMPEATAEAAPAAN
jgi:O-antigen/teichoic acid export membrane protein